MKYYVNTGNLIGKVYNATNDLEAVSYAVGFGYGKGWQIVNVYCQTTKETVTKDFPTGTARRYYNACNRYMEEFLKEDKPLWN